MNTRWFDAASDGNEAYIRDNLDIYSGSKNFRGDTALILAVKNHKHNCVALLLEREKRLRNIHGCTALYIAALNYDPEDPDNQRTVKQLSDVEGDLIVCEYLPSEYLSAFPDATIQDPVPVVQRIPDFNKIPMLFDVISCDGRKAAECGLVQFLDQPVINSMDHTPLMVAAQAGHAHIVKFLLENQRKYGGKTDPQTGYTAFLYACCAGNFACAELLSSVALEQEKSMKKFMEVMVLVRNIRCRELMATLRRVQEEHRRANPQLSRLLNNSFAFIIITPTSKRVHSILKGDRNGLTWFTALEEPKGSPYFIASLTTPADHSVRNSDLAKEAMRRAMELHLHLQRVARRISIIYSSDIPWVFCKLCQGLYTNLRGVDRI
ncbi:Ankyrin repeat protein 1 [Giardia muris]|uniref:Ankyrin repeat protein 1 n=1 Tax=Giardia muris TaxID=5742 RepID=A0A4Z1T6G6_GIAMU|nr:Ankyrin repeat protein 1 [Giardia muris]|eukprot:TNJ28727.1 Ankyrin repeat protein 1 [Giardia muris]